MKCYKHTSEPAVGICKHCNKAVCSECAIDTGNGLACSEQCVDEINAYNSMMGRAKNIYGLRANGQRMPLVVIMFLVLSVMGMGTGIYRYIAYSRIYYSAFFIGVAFLVLAILAYRELRKD